MKIRNNYHSNLSFPDVLISIGPGEIKEVDDKIGKKMLQNVWIKEVIEIKISKRKWKQEKKIKTTKRKKKKEFKK